MSEDYNETQTKILRYLSDNPPSAPSSHIKDAIDSVTRNAVDKQIIKLRDSGEIEKVGEAEPDRDGQWAPNVYALTKDGKKAAAQLPDDETADTGEASEQLVEQMRALREKVMDLEETVDSQAEYIDTLEAQVSDNADQLDTNEDRFKTLHDRTTALKERLDG